MDGIGESAVTAARELRVLFSRLRRRLRGLAVDDDLTPSQTAVLTRLWKEGASSAGALAGAERVRPQSMATIVAALEQRGLIKRTPDPEDGRRQMVTLTGGGRRRAERTHPALRPQRQLLADGRDWSMWPVQRTPLLHGRRSV